MPQKLVVGEPFNPHMFFMENNTEGLIIPSPLICKKYKLTDQEKLLFGKLFQEKEKEVSKHKIAWSLGWEIPKTTNIINKLIKKRLIIESPNNKSDFDVFEFKIPQDVINKMEKYMNQK